VTATVASSGVCSPMAAPCFRAMKNPSETRNDDAIAAISL
jgi:hypothetical protein